MDYGAVLPPSLMVFFVSKIKGYDEIKFKYILQLRLNLNIFCNLEKYNWPPHTGE